MRRFLVLVLLSAACHGPSSGEVAREQHQTSIVEPGPVVAIGIDSTYHLVTPPTMARLLEDSVPGFAPWTIEHYDADVRRFYLFSHRSTPWAAVGDFNGDGVEDLVVDGHDRHRMLRLCLLSGDEGYRLLVLKTKPWDTGVSDLGRSIEVLQFRGPGRIRTNFSKDWFILRTDAFEVEFFEKAATLFYWDRDHFAEFLTAD